MDEQKNEQPTVQNEDKDIQENKIIAALSYIGILVLVPLLVKKDSKFCKFHAKQGLIMLIIFIVGWLIFWIPFIGWLIWIAAVILDLLALIQTLQGKYWEIPVVGSWAKKLNI
jgi:uncharacterized membrane protein